MSEAEADAVAVIGGFLGSVYRAELAGRVRLGRLDRGSQGRWRAERKQAVTVVASSRWAGAITRAVEDQYQLAMRGVDAHVTDLRRGIDVLEARCVVRSGEHAAPPADAGGPVRRGYRSAGERFAKTRRLAILRERLTCAQEALASGRPSVTAGGKRLWRNRSHLDATAMTEGQWRSRWDAARMFLTADGESGKAGGNETIRVDESGRLRIKVPAALAGQFGIHLDIEAPLVFAHRGREWAARVAGRRAVRYDITFDPAKGRWYLHASWKQDAVTAPPTIERLRRGPVLGVDLNADHLASWVLDGSGNPVGNPITIPVAAVGLAASRRDGHIRAAITAMLDAADHAGCTAVVIENLDFADARAVGRETMGRGQRGKRFRRTVAGIPTARFRTRLTAMAPIEVSRSSGWMRPTPVSGVPNTGSNPWNSRLPTRSLAITARRPRSADVASDYRSGDGRQDPATDSGPLRALHRPGPIRQPDHVGRRGSSGPPTRTRCAPVHRRTPAASGQHRSGRGRAGVTASHSRGTVPSYFSRKMTARCTTKLITVAVPCAMTNARGFRHHESSSAATRTWLIPTWTTNVVM